MVVMARWAKATDTLYEKPTCGRRQFTVGDQSEHRPATDLQVLGGQPVDSRPVDERSGVSVPTVRAG